MRGASGHWSDNTDSAMNGVCAGADLLIAIILGAIGV